MQKDSIILFVKGLVKKDPRLRNFLANFVDHFYEDLDGYKVFLEKNRSRPVKINIGAGSSLNNARFLNIDFCYFPGVHLRADAFRLPFKENSVDAILSEQLIEHVANPRELAEEFYRVLKTDGEIYITAPFMYPYHEAPIDLHRWTLEGFRNLMAGFAPIKTGVLGGPTATLVEALHGWLSVLFSFNSDKLYQVVYLLLIPFVKPFKILDLILLNRYKSAHRSAAMFYYYGKKGPSPEPKSIDT